MRARDRSYPISLTGKDIMTIKDDNERQRKVLLDRREALTCMTWAGTGLLWAMNGGVPLTKGLIGDAHAAASAPKEFAFVQISDSHIGFNKPANPDATGTLKEAIAKIKALPVRPAFLIHTGDISHLSKDEEFDNADQIIKEAGLPVFYVPGEHDVIDDGRGQSYRTRYGKNAQGSGWHSFDYNGVHYVGLVNVMDLKAGGLGNLGDEQLTWLEKTFRACLPARPSSFSRIFRFGPSTPTGAGARMTQRRRYRPLRGLVR